MKIIFRTLTDGKIAAKLEGGSVEGFGETKEKAIAELKRWTEIMGNIKWVDALTGKEVKK